MRNKRELILFFLLEKSIDILKINPPNSSAEFMVEDICKIFSKLCVEYFKEHKEK